MNSEDCTVLVVSCDGYADVVPPFEALWRKFWPDCPFTTVLLTETLPAEDGVFDRVVRTGPCLSWSRRVEQGLAQIATPYVLLLCNDYYLCSRVDTAQILARLEQAKRLGAANLRLNPNPRPSQVFDPGLRLLAYRKNTAYCISTQAGFWDRSFLLGLLAKTDSAWEFERRGSYLLADEPRPLLATMEKEFPFLDAVHKGCWDREGVALCESNGIKLDFDARKLPSAGVRLKEWIKAVVFRLSPTLVTKTLNAISDLRRSDRR